MDPKSVVDLLNSHDISAKEPAMKKNIVMPEFKFCKTKKVIGVDSYWCKVTQADPRICEHSDKVNNDLYFCHHPERSTFER
jgi:hypothetical protein